MQIVPLTPPRSKSGYAFSIEYNDHPFLLLDAGCGSDRSFDWLEGTAPHPYVWISHGHADHVGALPVLLQRWPTPQVYTAQEALPAIKGQLKSIGYDPARVESIVSNFHTVSSHTPFSLKREMGDRVEEITAVTAPSGHGIGAHMLKLAFPHSGDTFRVGYTGDWALHERTGTPSCDTTLLDDVDVLIAEAALCHAGELEEYDHAAEQERFQEFLSHDAPRLVVVAPFSELEEVIHLVQKATQSRGQTPYFASGIGTLMGVEETSIPLCQQRLLENKCVIACDSSLELTKPSGQLAAGLLEDPNARIALINRVPVHSPAHTLRTTTRRSRTTIYGQRRRIRARVDHFLFPDHTLPQDLVLFLDNVCHHNTITKQVLLFHSTEEKLYKLKERVEGERTGGKICIGAKLSSGLL